jgi:alpha-tubulin suppressor-like RCC1 family protein
MELGGVRSISLLRSRFYGKSVVLGLNEKGQLGNGTTTNAFTPVAVAGNMKFKQLTAGYWHTCGLDTSGKAYCWGYNNEGQLGDGTNKDRSTPTPVRGGKSWMRLSAGSWHSCSLDLSRKIWCWGDNDGYQLGDGTGVRSTAPVPLSSDNSWKILSSGGGHTCSINDSDDIFCWGYNDYGQLGDGTIDKTSKLVRLLGGAASAWVSVDAGERHTCALDSAGQTWCWGRSHPSPFWPCMCHEYFNLLLTGSRLLNESAIFFLHCSGWNLHGQLGDGTVKDRQRPVRVSGRKTFVLLSAGYSHTCGLNAAGTAFCWGKNDWGQAGDGDRVVVLEPEFFATGPNQPKFVIPPEGTPTTSPVAEPVPETTPALEQGAPLPPTSSTGIPPEGTPTTSPVAEPVRETTPALEQGAPLPPTSSTGIPPEGTPTTSPVAEPVPETTPALEQGDPAKDASSSPTPKIGSPSSVPATSSSSSLPIGVILGGVLGGIAVAGELPWWSY